MAPASFRRTLWTTASRRSDSVGSRSSTASAHGRQEGALVPFPQHDVESYDLVVHREDHALLVAEEPRVLREHGLDELPDGRAVPERPGELPLAHDLAVRREEPHLNLHRRDSDGLGRR